MTNRIFITLALFASAAVGVGAGVLVSQATAPDDGQRQDVNSITGVSSGVEGSQTKEPEKEGVDQIAIPPETPPTTDPSDPNTDAESDDTQSQTVDIEGVEGTDGVSTEPENTVEILTTTDDTVQSIRGIKGIDTVMLQNLETVLRMQAPPPPPEEGGGGGRAAAALFTMENDEPPDPEDEIDGRQELTEFELEGS